MERASEAKESLRYSPYNDVLARKRLGAVLRQVLAYDAKAEKDGITVLDLGCGIGGMTYPLSYLGYKVVGVDVDPQSIEACNGNNAFPNATYLASDIAGLDLGEQFDVVICCEVLEHSADPGQLIETIGRHLSQNSIAIITVPNGYSLYEIVFSRLFQRLRITTLFHRLPNRLYRAMTGSPSPYHSLNVFCGHVQFLTLKRCKKLLSNGGLYPVDISNQSLGLFLDWKWLSPLRWLECKLADLAPHFIAGGWVFVAEKGVKAQK